MSEEKAACIDVVVKCNGTGCDNSVSLQDLNSSGPGYFIVESNLRYICTKCGKDMVIVVEKTTHTATTKVIT